MTSDIEWMRRALQQARSAADAGEVPVGAVLVLSGDMIARAGNAAIGANDPTAHAELTVLREAAAAVGNYRLTDAVLYVTLEPCAMCFGAMVHARVARVVFGAADPKSGVLGGAIDLRDAVSFNHHPEVVGGVLAAECAALLKMFFADKRSC